MMRRLFTALLILWMLTTAVLAAGGSPKIVDDADLIDAYTEALLAQQAEQIADSYGVDVVIVTVYSLNGQSAESFADDYFDYNGYGIGPDYSGILLLISMEYREWAISTCGDCIRYFSDRTLDQLFDSMAYDLSADNYAGAFSTYLDELEFTLANAGSEDGEGSGSLFKKLGISLLIGAAAGAIVLMIMRSGMNTAKMQHGASDYLVNGSFHLYLQQDIFLYSRTTRTRKQQNNTSSSHRSSSGRSHGGRSGRF